MNFILNTTCTMKKIKIASELLNERAEKTTDATAFIVTTEKDRIVLTADSDRRDGHDLGTFYHMDAVVSICTPLHLSYWITAKTYADAYGNNRATFEVHIY